MTRFFRSALFPLIVIVLLVYLASQTLIPQEKSARKVTYSELIERVQDDPNSIRLVEFNPKKQQITATPDERERPEDQGPLPDAAVADRVPEPPAA